MLTTQNYIIKNISLSKSQDFDSLRREGVEHITQLSSALWTDYNLHDPGITILETLCYAITDLGFRTTYPIRDLLTVLDANGVPQNDSDFHTARTILTTFPVTFDDLRKVLVDIKGVRMAWIRKNNEARYDINRTTETLREVEKNSIDSVSNECFVLRGLFDVFIEFEEGVSSEKSAALGTGISNLPSIKLENFLTPKASNKIRSLEFDVLHDEIILESVTVYPKSNGKLIIRLMNDDTKLPIETIEYDLKKIKTPTTRTIKGTMPKGIVIPLNWHIKKGTKYRLDAKGSRAEGGEEESLELLTVVGDEVKFPDYSIPDVLNLNKSTIGKQTTDGYFFFFDWKVGFTQPLFQLPKTIQALVQVLTQEDVLTEVKHRLHICRNLCEDFVRVCQMRNEEIALCTDIDVAPYVNIEDVQAEILYRLSNFISPPIQFYTLDEIRAKGKTMEDIFEGPQLEHGFIDHDEFKQITRICQLKLSDVFQIIMDIKGVTAVRQIELVSFIEGETKTHSSSLEDGQWLHPLSSDQFLAPIFSPERSKIFFYKNNLPYLANKTKAEYALSEKKAQDIYTKLNGAVEDDLDLPVPVGTFRDLGAYSSIQNDLPETYRVGCNRVPASANLFRKAQAQQLKGYLLHFDQILANSMAQLANLKNLFGWSNSSMSSYFSPPLSKEGIFDLENLYDNFAALTATLSEIVESPATAIERKGAFLDHLAARFAENLSEYSQLMRTLYAETEQQRQIIEDKQRLLARYPEASAQRLNSFDYRFPQLLEKWDKDENLTDLQRILRDNITGYQKRTYALLGFDNWYRQQLAGHRLLVEEIEEAGQIKYWFILKNEALTANLFESIKCPNKQDIEMLLDDAFDIGSDKANFNNTTLALEQDCNGVKNAMGVLKNLADLQEVVDYFIMYSNIEGFHVVEHLLLRKRTKQDPFMPIQLHKETEPCDCPEVKDPYSFRMSVYLPSWSKRFKKIRFRQHIEKVLREECPAHIFPKICWISHEQMVDFEKKYTAWLDVLRQLPIGECCLDIEGKKDECINRQRGGLTPLPPTLLSVPTPPKTLDEQYRDTLKDLIELMLEVDNVFPTARLHSCEETDGDNPEISLDNTSLGTL
jgi:hypothetical protein